MANMLDLKEITQTWNDPDNFKNDMSAAMALVGQHFRKKYLDPMSRAYAEQHAKCLKEPCPQVALLQACKPFVRDTSALDKMIESISGCDALKGMMYAMSKNTAADAAGNVPAVRKESGAYDNGGEQTAPKKTEQSSNMALMLALLLLGKQ